MSTPQKTLLVEKISYAQEALKHIRDELKALVNHIDGEYQIITQELEFLESRENEVSERTFSWINAFFQNAWERAMLARNNLKDLADDFAICEEDLKKLITEIKKARKLRI